jgi:hypothetical protein
MFVRKKIERVIRRRRRIDGTQIGQCAAQLHHKTIIKFDDCRVWSGGDSSSSRKRVIEVGGTDTESHLSLLPPLHLIADRCTASSDFYITSTCLLRCCNVFCATAAIEAGAGPARSPFVFFARPAAIPPTFLHSLINYPLIIAIGKS